ncbi:MAG: hypothetical protein ACRDP1_09675 [Nocardioidaceae bacterium]
MTDPQTLPRSDPRRHTIKTRTRLTELAEHLRSDVTKVDDPRAKALFETAAEVLLGLERAFADFEAGTEAAWR